MEKSYLKSLIDEVSVIEVQNETQQIAKYELIEYVEELQDRIDKVINILDNFDAWLEPQDTKKIRNCIEILKRGTK
jgi:hypothetical protein